MAVSQIVAQRQIAPPNGSKRDCITPVLLHAAQNKAPCLTAICTLVDGIFEGSNSGVSMMQLQRFCQNQ